MGDNKGSLEELLDNMYSSILAERKKSKPYKEMFKAGHSFTGLLRHLDHTMVKAVLDACEVYKEKTGNGVNRQQLSFLMALPFLAIVIEKKIEKEEGPSCCVDKGFFLLAHELENLAENGTYE